MSFSKRIQEMVTAVERGDARGVAACFTPDGIYDDVFYGDFQGEGIAEMIEDHFYRDATDFRWDLHDIVEQNDLGYARYVFSYQPKFEGAAPQRAVFEGVAICRMRDGLITDYSEIANAAVGLQCTGFPPERLAKFIGKQSAELQARNEAARHIA